MTTPNFLAQAWLVITIGLLTVCFIDEVIYQNNAAQQSQRSRQ